MITQEMMVYVSMGCTFFISSIHIIFIVFTLYNNNTLNIILWILYALFFALIVIMEEVGGIKILSPIEKNNNNMGCENFRVNFKFVKDCVEESQLY